MANFVTVSLECRTEEVRTAFKDACSIHREFVPKPSKSSGMPDLMVLEIDEFNPTRTLSEVRSMSQSSPRTEVILISKRADPQIMLQAMRLGVKEFLPEPLHGKEIEEALLRFKARFSAQNQNANVQLGAVLAILGGKAGIGTTTVALNLAVSLQQSAERNANTVLVDLNLSSNDLTLYLDLPTKEGWRDLSQDISRLDPSMLQGMLAKHSSGVHLLGSSEDLEETLAPGCVLYTIDLLRSMFDYVVVDCGSRMTDSVEECLELSSHVYMVTNLSVPSIRHSKRMLQKIQDTVGGSVPTALVVNRYRSRDAELLKHAEEMLRQKANWLIPNDYASVSQALDEGTALLQPYPKSEVTMNYRKRAADVMKEWTHRKKGTYGLSDDHKTESLFGKIWTSVTSGVRIKASHT